jgi:adenylate cyclase
VALGPGETIALVSNAMTLAYCGRPEEAIPILQKAIRLNPFVPTYLYRCFGQALKMAGRFEEAGSALKKAIHLEPDDLFAHLDLAGTYIMMGREKEARAEAAEVLRINPKFLVDSLNMPDNYLSSLRKAGLK